jgi:glycosyltransferase involved in cell wall biosynthesis
VNKFFLERLAGVIVLGPAHVDIYEGVVAKDRVFSVPNFAEEYLFAESDAIDAKFAKCTPLRLLFLSNFLPGKGHSELLDAIGSLDDDTRSRLTIDLAGAFQSADEERTFLRLAGRMPNVRYHGVVAGERKRQLLAAAHVLCLPTYYAFEGQPISILEGYAAGCAVIATNHSGIGDVFSEGVNGYLVEKRSVDSLREAIERAVQNPSALLAFARKNHATAVRQYRPSRYTGDLLRILSAVQTRLDSR